MPLLLHQAEKTRNLAKRPYLDWQSSQHSSLWCKIKYSITLFSSFSSLPCEGLGWYTFGKVRYLFSPHHLPPFLDISDVGSATQELGGGVRTLNCHQLQLQGDPPWVRGHSSQSGCNVIDAYQWTYLCMTCFGGCIRTGLQSFNELSQEVWPPSPAHIILLQILKKFINEKIILS